VNWFKSKESESSLNWQRLTSSGAIAAHRAAVPGGWLVFAVYAGNFGGVTFLPDKDHQWDGASPLVPPAGTNSAR